ncbi:ribonucleases P/MRP protein subunit POP1 isoform X2 [Cryptomeria japonica]|uniref:ribonucleases P/MRP protein subunit POP1 isoform X2 n=1 Tax=Cryptomeria japonica TaxID=3369 RepID=UPI0027DA1D84|nr:ribonucleases P/MRP protein subunit POP1 isoform X2 [Cryptomeria japonica]
MKRPPPALNVKRLANARAPEVEALYSIIKKRIRKRKGPDDGEQDDNQDFAVPRTERRRTTGFINRKANLWKKRKRDALRRSTRFKIKGEEERDGKADTVKKLSRRVRRRIELKGGSDGGYGCSTDGTIRLATHVWHAKRFTMTKKWGYYLPLGLFGRGRGSRAVLKWSKSTALLHDASYYSAVQLEGPEDSLLNVLRKVLEPSPPLVETMSEMLIAELCGLCYGTAMLHKVGESPYGSITPVTYLWCPYSPDAFKATVDRDMKDRSTYNDKEKKQNNQTRYLWIWIHAAAFHDAFNSLQSACQIQSEEDGTILMCLSRQHDLGRLDVIGSRALKLLQKILHPISRWSIILPVSWVRAFWIPLVLGGARAIGLRERRWLSSDAGVSSFPYDFPDCKAYCDYMNEETAAYEEMIASRPPSKRPPAILLPPPWNSIQGYVKRKYSGSAALLADITKQESEKTELVEVQRLHSVNSLQDKLAIPEVINKEDLGSQGFSSIHEKKFIFPGLIARTSAILKQHLRRVGGLHLLLFPDTHSSQKKDYSHLLDEGRICWRLKDVNNIILENEPCFLKVLLYAPGKGLFEEGAVVCAPIENDFSLWCSKSRGWQGLDIPPTLRNAECNQQWITNKEMGQWGGIVSNCGQENLRMPIGFVTTGACRGSVPALAVAMCEGTILGHLRADQWKDSKWRNKSEVFVLVRNMKSTVYRPALAAIILEENEDKFYW